jgi:predicted Holliday junction resolvase-like endonuclease
MNLFVEYQLFRKILAFCPCGKIHRVSDLRLISKAKTPKTWLDEYEANARTLSEKEEAFADQIKNLRMEAVEKGRKEAVRAFYNAVCPSIRKLKINPFDLKPILNPIDFVAFNGMTEDEEISDIVLLTREHPCAYLNPIRGQIRKAVEKNRYEWQVAHIDETGKILMEEV